MSTAPRTLALAGALALFPLLAFRTAQDTGALERRLLWPPHPSRIVSFSERISFVSIPPGGTYTLYRVPDNEWLVLTDLVVRRSTQGQDAQWLHVRQLLDGVLTRKLGRGCVTSGWAAEPVTGQAGYHSALGTVFEPGSEVVLFNDPLAPLTVSEVRIEAFDGYLVRASG